LFFPAKFDEADLQLLALPCCQLDSAVSPLKDSFKMPKRKRDDAHGSSTSGASTTLNAQQLGRFRATTDQSQKSLVAALKLARGFERQKMGRRQRNAAKDPRSLLQRREELIVLKQLDLDKTAKNHLVKSLLKAKRVRESPVFIVVYGSEPRLDPVSTVEGIVLGRLFNSNPVKLAMGRIMSGLFETLNIGPSKKQKSNSRAKTIESQRKEADSPPNDLDPMEITEDEDRVGEESFSKSDESAGGGSVASSAGDPGDSLIAASSEEERAAADETTFNSKQGSSKRTARPSNPIDSTAFLPSLSMGGYYSGSDSSDDDESKNIGGALPKDRKNRRGQRARQQLAEMKYGSKAKHLQKPSSGRNTDWDRRKGAVGATDRRADRKMVGSQPRHAGGPVKPPKPLKRDDTGPIHPSWEAAKQRKLQSAAPAAFSGKKITFD
jgi:hypothetical protein